MHCLISLVKERPYTQHKNTLNTRTQRNRVVQKFHLANVFEFGVTVFFSNGSSRKFFINLDRYFVLLEQLASLFNEWRTPKNYFVFCLKKLNHPRFTYKSYTNAVIPDCNIFQVFLDQQKSCN